jgi:Leucine-rich repeat (LRR) protein
VELSGLQKLQNLRTLNLSSNLVEFLDLPEMKNLIELNLRKNKITLINKLIGFNSLLKLNLGQNAIKSISNIENSLPQLKELVLDQNPIANSATFGQNLPKSFPSLVYYNMQKIKDDGRENLMGS